ncbi:MAG: hypothetical protein IJ329_00315 [Clostridia bacterium]|nr:hypothetical protein [Clostridia bacterium]
MKKSFLFTLAILIVCAFAVLAVSTHFLEPRAETPVYAKMRTFAHFAP